MSMLGSASECLALDLPNQFLMDWGLCYIMLHFRYFRPFLSKIQKSKRRLPLSFDLIVQMLVLNQTRCDFGNGNIP
jgi:hypothetical protein